jgi:hypothetical protein
LRYGIFEKHHILIKRLNMALELDAIHEVHRDRDMLFAQGVEKGVLEGLAFIHGHFLAPVLF